MFTIMSVDCLLKHLHLFFSYFPKKSMYLYINTKMLDIRSCCLNNHHHFYE